MTNENRLPEQFKELIVAMMAAAYETGYHNARELPPSTRLVDEKNFKFPPEKEDWDLDEEALICGEKMWDEQGYFQIALTNV